MKNKKFEFSYVTVKVTGASISGGSGSKDAGVTCLLTAKVQSIK